MKEKKNCTVLLVDDSPEDRYVFADYLQRSTDCAYTILEAGDLQAGLRLCQQVRIDCVLLDYELPDSTGLDFIDSMRDADQNVTVPVVMITGHGNEDVAVSAMKAGAIDYLVKDRVTPESLFRVTQNALARLTTLNELANQTRERTRIEGELRDSETRFRLLVSSVSDYAIVMLSLNGTISTWNQGARKIFGYHDRDIIGQQFSCLYTPCHHKEERADADLALAAAEQRCESEQLLVRRDRTELHALSVIAPLVDSSGQRKGFSWVVRDLTERHTNREAMARATLASNEFLDSASHELRTPATALLLNLEALERQAHRPDAQNLPWFDARLSVANRLAKNLAERINALFPVEQESLTSHNSRHD